MAEFREFPADTFVVRAYCACGTEFEKDDKGIRMTHPPMIGYVCPACGETELLNDFYPNVINRPTPSPSTET